MWQLLWILLLFFPSLAWGQRIPGQVLPDQIVALAAPTNGQCLTFSAAGRIFAWAACGSGAGDITTVGNCTTGDCAIEGGTDIFPFIYEGTADAFETTFAVTDPTADRTLTFPNETGTICTTGSVCTGYTPSSRTLTVAGTSNEVTSSAGAQDLSANRTWTLSLPAALNLASKELLGASPLQFEGATDDNVYTTIAITDPTLARTFTIPNANSVAVQPQTCTGDDKVSAISAAGVLTCSTDQTGAGGGDPVLINTVAIVDAAGVDFTDGTGITITLNAAVSPDTATIAATLGTAIDTTEITDGTITYADVNATQTIGANPANGASSVWFGTTGLIFEGSTSDTIEGLLTAADPTASDKTWTLPNETGTICTTGSVCSGYQASLGFTAVPDSRTVTVAGTSLDITSSAGAQDLTANRTWTLSLDRSATLAGNPAYAANTAGLSANGIIFEGATADTIETLLTAADPTSSDKTITLPNETGTVCTTGSVCSGYQAGALTGDVTTSGAAATLATKHKTRMLSFNLEDPAVGDDGNFQAKIVNASTLVRVSCSTTSGSAAIQFYERAENSPNTGTTSMLTSNLTCDSDTTADVTTSFADSAVAANAVLALGIKTDSTTGILRVYVEYTVD